MTYQRSMRMKVGELYAFTVYIKDILPSTTNDDVNIWSEFPE